MSNCQLKDFRQCVRKGTGLRNVDEIASTVQAGTAPFCVSELFIFCGLFGDWGNEITLQVGIVHA